MSMGHYSSIHQLKDLGFFIKLIVSKPLKNKICHDLGSRSMNSWERQGLITNVFQPN